MSGVAVARSASGGRGLWVKLLTDLLRWGREGRDVSWKYPALWAGVTFFNISFAIAFLVRS
jgi:hypothetical protein